MLEFISETAAAKQAYVSALPLWVQYWMDYMTVVFILGVVFIKNQVEARWVLGGVLAAMAGAFVWGGIYGFGQAWGIWHLLFWTPAVWIVLRNRNGITWKSLYGYWLLVAVTTMVISLVFDLKDVIQAWIS